jgi:hypothetical protein
LVQPNRADWANLLADKKRDLPMGAKSELALQVDSDMNSCD